MRSSESIGVGLLALLPLLALLGWFGPTTSTAGNQTGPIELEVEYPARLRFHMVEHLVVRVTNVGQEPLHEVAVTIDSAYVRGFSEVIFTPEVDRAHTIELEPLQPAEARLISVELKADRYGMSRGEVSAAHGDTRVVVPLSTLILP